MLGILSRYLHSINNLTKFEMQDTPEIKRTLFIWTKQEKKKRAIFRGSPLFQATNHMKTEKKAIYSQSTRFQIFLNEI